MPQPLAHPGPPDAPRKAGCLGRVFATLGIAVSLIYLLNPGAGVFELIPDNVPFVGNIDEGFFTAMLLWCLSYLGVKVLPWRRR